MQRVMVAQPQGSARGSALAQIPVVRGKDSVSVLPRTIAPPARASTEPCRAYKPRPFTREEREKVTVLFG